MDLYLALEAESTAKLEIVKVNFVVHWLDTSLILTGRLLKGERTYVLGRTSRSTGAMVVTDRIRYWILAKETRILDFKLKIQGLDLEGLMRGPEGGRVT